MSRSMRNLLVLSAILIALQAPGRAAADDAAASPTFEPFSLTAESGETVTGELGTIWVPENRERPGSRQIPLRFLRLKATGAAPGDPVIYLAGGPGASAIRDARGERLSLFLALREHSDVILLEQRGVGLSNSVPDCQTRGLIAPGQPFTRDTLTAGYRRELAGCIDFWRRAGVDVAGYDTVQSADDVEDLRRALGVERVNLLGISYGTHLGMSVLRRHGEHIGRAVLTGLDGPDQNVKEPRYFDAYLGRVADTIAADPVAREAYPDLLGVMKRVHARLDAEPARVTLSEAGGQQTEVVFDSFPVRLIVSGLYFAEPASIPGMARLYARLDGGDYERVARFLPGAVQAEFGSLRATRALMDLSSGASPQLLAAVAAQEPGALMGDAGNFPVPHVIGLAPELDLGAAFRTGFTTAVPTLVIMGTLDGRTPLESQLAMMGHFTNGRVLTMENAGHNTLGHPLLTREIVDFLRSGEIRQTTLVLPPPSFAPAS